MNNFIEVTDLEGRKHLINIMWVEEICEGYHASIYFAFQDKNAVGQDVLKVRESYRDIKRTMWGNNQWMPENS